MNVDVVACILFSTDLRFAKQYIHDLIFLTACLLRMGGGFTLHCISGDRCA